MSFFEYPNTRTYASDLGWLIEAMKELIEKVDTFIDVNKIKFADPITWSITKQYAANTIVISADGEGYISRKNVPEGVTLDNADYWTKLFDFSELLEVLRHQIAANDDGSSATATFASTVGELVWLNNILYRAVENISIGTAYIDGENIEHVTVEGLLKDVSNRVSNTRFVLFGDSFTQGGIFNILNNLFDAEASYNFGVSGTGFARSGFSSFQDQINNALTTLTTEEVESINMILVLGGINDQWDDTSTLSSAVDTFFNTVHESFSNAKVYYIPNWGARSFPYAYRQLLTGSIFNHIKYATILNDPLYALIGAGDYYINADLIHPTTAGYDLLARKIYNSVNGHSMSSVLDISEVSTTTVKSRMIRNNDMVDFSAKVSAPIVSGTYLGSPLSICGRVDSAVTFFTHPVYNINGAFVGNMTFNSGGVQLWVADGGSSDVDVNVTMSFNVTGIAD